MTNNSGGRRSMSLGSADPREHRRADEVVTPLERDAQGRISLAPMAGFSDSSATTVDELRADFNSLLAHMRSQGRMQ